MMAAILTHYLLRTTEYSDDSLRASKTLIEFGSPRPNAGEGLGVRGASTRLDVVASLPRPSSRAGFRELIQQRSIPLTPGPSPALGRGEPILSTVGAEQSTHSCHYGLQCSIGTTRDPTGNRVRLPARASGYPFKWANFNFRQAEFSVPVLQLAPWPISQRRNLQVGASLHP